MAGIIPKTERKVKNPTPPKGTDGGGSTKLDSNSNSSNSNLSSGGSLKNNILTKKPDPNAVFKFEEEPAEIQWIPKGGSINGLVNGGKVTIPTTTTKGKDLQVLKKEVNGQLINGLANNKLLNKVEVKNGKLNQVLTNGVEYSMTDKSPKCRQTYGKKPPASTGAKQKITIIKNETSCELVTPPPNSHCPTKSAEIKQEQLLPPPSLPPLSSSSSSCEPENAKFFDQWKTLKSVEKSVSSSQPLVDSPPEELTSALNSSSTFRSLNKPTNSSRTISALQKQKSTLESKINMTNVTKISSKNSLESSVVVDLFNSINAQKVCSLLQFPLSSISSLPKNGVTLGRNGESRQEFLARVRHAFKSHYLTIKNSAQDSDKNEKIWKRALRNSLLTCVVKDSSHSAHVIAETDPKKYSDLNQNQVTEIDLFEESFNSKLKNPKLNQTPSNIGGLGKQGKNGLIQGVVDVKSEGREKSKPKPNAINSKLVNGKTIPSIGPEENDGNQKVFKRIFK